MEQQTEYILPADAFLQTVGVDRVAIRNFKKICSLSCAPIPPEPDTFCGEYMRNKSFTQDEINL